MKLFHILFKLAGEFTISSFLDGNFNDAVTSTVRAVLGNPVFNRVSVTGTLSTNIDFAKPLVDLNKSAYVTAGGAPGVLLGPP